MKPRAKQVRNVLRATIDNLFERTKARILGKFYNGPKIFFQIIRDFGIDNSLEGSFRHALMHAAGTGAKIDDEILEAHAEETESLIDALKSKMYKEAFHAVKINDMDKLKEIFESATNHVETITATEFRHAQSLGEDSGLMQVAASQGIEDPTIFWVGRLDEKTCKHCLAMYHSQDNPKIPRLWKRSDLKEGYFKPKLWDGNSVYRNAHPRCRHSMTILMPSFGFNDNGNVTYKYPHYDGHADRKDK